MRRLLQSQLYTLYTNSFECDLYTPSAAHKTHARSVDTRFIKHCYQNHLFPFRQSAFRLAPFNINCCPDRAQQHHLSN